MHPESRDIEIIEQMFYNCIVIVHDEPVRGDAQMKTDDWNVAERMKKANIPGLSVAFIDHGRLSFQGHWGKLAVGDEEKVQSDTLFNACSISKFAAAMLALVLVEDGTLELDENVSDRLLAWGIPEHSEYDYMGITLRRLLSHQAGFADPEGSYGKYSREHGIPSMGELLRGKTDYSQEPASLVAEPGTRFVYTDTGYCIIQGLIEDATGKPFAKVMQDKIFVPLHMNHSRIVASDLDICPGSAAGHNKHGERLLTPYTVYPFPAAAGLWSTPSDLAFLLMELLDSLHGKGKLGISDRMAAEMITSQGCFQWTGLGVFLDTVNDRLEFSSLGWGMGYQCMLIAYPDTGKGAVLMMNADPGVHQNQSLLGQLADLWRHEQFG